ncbi:MAG: heme-binding domain-containing protein, partial [Bryocella sp.]
MKFVGKALLVAAIIFALLQLVHPRIPASTPLAELQAPPAVRQVLQKNCYACHSSEVKLSWFDQIQPAYWFVRSDILTAREHLNFSTLGSKPMAAQRATLFEAVNMMQLGAMPPPRFTALHPDAKVTPEDLAILKAYLAPWSTTPPTSNNNPIAQPSANLSAIPAEYNGLAFDPTFESWTPISFTDRGDNNSLRFILGNDIAIKAAHSGNISSWPDGTRFAKIAWAKETGPDGLIHPGKFIQVEFMIKDARLYKKTAGWGWGRWRGLDLKPYGKDAAFVGECTSCHLPMRGADNVFTLPITTAASAAEEVVNNRAAALPSGLPFNPLTWNAITLFVDPATHTT